MDKKNGILVSLNIECKNKDMSFIIVEEFEKNILVFLVHHMPLL